MKKNLSFPLPLLLYLYLTFHDLPDKKNVTPYYLPFTHLECASSLYHFVSCPIQSSHFFLPSLLLFIPSWLVPLSCLAAPPLSSQELKISITEDESVWVCLEVCLCVSKCRHSHKLKLLVIWIKIETEVLFMGVFSMCVCLCFPVVPSSGVVRLDLKSLSSPLSWRRLSVQPTGLQALTVTMYRVDGVRPDNTPGEEKSMNMSQLEWGREHRQRNCLPKTL